MKTKVPVDGDDRRAWIRFELQNIRNPETGRRFTQADIAREAHATDSTVSLVFSGKRSNGPKIDKIRRITARILNRSTDELFGVALEAGDGYAGSKPRKAKRGA